MITLTAGFGRFASPRRSERSALIAIWGVYIVQGQLGGLTFVALPAILRTKHVPMEQIAVFSAIILIWALKFIWAARVEQLRQQMMGRFGFGRAIFLAELVIAGLIIGAALFPFCSILPFLTIFTGAAFLASVIDIATDGYLIAHFPPPFGVLARQRRWGAVISALHWAAVFCPHSMTMPVGPSVALSRVA
ncbi:hypothetical protein CGLAMM_05975 [Acetobacteraceae bacterium EV16G]|uniref:hypothetical protein n=1 Tax=Sorlinia euscelidii TaxID=3081148 RepID=UPI002F38827D